MRIVLASIRYPPSPGGAETHVQALARGFAARGHDVQVHTSDLFTEYPFVRRQDLPKTDEGGVRVVRHPAERLFGSWTRIRGMTRALTKAAGDADVVHAHSYGYYQTVAAARSAAERRKPFVFTPHFHPPWSMEGGAFRRVLRGAYDPLLGQYSVGRADAIIGVSSAEMREMSKHLRVPPEKVEIIPNGFHAREFQPPPSRLAFREKLGLNADTPVVLFAGRLASNKGLQHLVPAFARLAPEFPGARLVLAGEDQGWGPRLREMAMRLGIADRLVFTGHLALEDYRAALACADVFVLPSEWEAFGIVLVESMACGVPCVATRVGGAADVVLDGETGFLVPYGDDAALAESIRRVLADPALARRLGEAGQKRAFAEYSWDAVVDRTLALYRDVIAKRG